MTLKTFNAMTDTLENLQRKTVSMAELKSVVRTMKALSAANITQYELAVKALRDYFQSVSLGLTACLHQQRERSPVDTPRSGINEKLKCMLVFGSDQGLVGRFNDSLAEFAMGTLKDMEGETEIWTIGERMYSVFDGAGKTPAKLFAVPNSVDGITALVNEILMDIEDARERKHLAAVYVFQNSPGPDAGYRQSSRRLLPLDRLWADEFAAPAWPTLNVPQVFGGVEAVLPALIREYLFVSLYKACAESLASENASRLAAMQRAEKNIEDMLGNLSQSYNRLRQSTIDEELFDVVSGFEALKVKKKA